MILAQVPSELCSLLRPFPSLCVSWLVMWRPALLPWGGMESTMVLHGNLQSPQRGPRRQHELSPAFCCAATLPSPARSPSARTALPERCLPEPTQVHQENELGPPLSHAALNQHITAAEKRQDLAPDLLAFSTKHQHILLAVSSQLPAQHNSFLNPVLQFLLPARPTHLWAAANALLPVR